MIPTETMAHEIPKTRADQIPKTMPRIPYDPKTAADNLLNLLKAVDNNAQIKNLEHFIFANSAIFKGQRVIFIPNSIYNGVPHLRAELAIQRKIKNKDIKSSQEQTEAFQVLASEYKIHIMPKPEYMLGVVAEFLLACTKDPKLQRYIHSFKIRKRPINLHSIPPGTVKKQIVPQMVIYLKIEEASTNYELRKKSANYVLNALYQIYSVYDIREIGLGIPARYSLIINALICYAQGGGDVKNTMTDSQKVIFLSQSEVHYNLPNQHLDNPALSDLKCFAELVGKLHTVTPFKFKDITFQEGGLENLSPHVRSVLELPENPQNPGNLLPEDLKLLNLLSEIMVKINVKAEGVISKETIIINDNKYLKVDIVIYLPSFVLPVRSGFKALFDTCQIVFNLPSELSAGNTRKIKVEPIKDTKEPKEDTKQEPKLPPSIQFNRPKPGSPKPESYKSDSSKPTETPALKTPAAKRKAEELDSEPNAELDSEERPRKRRRRR